MSGTAVRFDRVSKRFPGVQALDGVSLEIAAGTCHALCGENGAGKSTLGKILAGIYAPDGGTLEVHGQPVRFSSPRDALDAGVGMVHQELAFCENMSVAENLCLSDLPSSRAGFVARDETRRRADEMLAQIDARLDVDQPLRRLTIAQRQIVQVASAVGSGARIVVFDEPTSSLSQADADRLYELIDRLKARGVTCIYVSHRMPEIFRLCDTVTVLRDGRHVATRPTRELTEPDIVQMMIGRSLAEYEGRGAARTPGAEMLRVERLTVPGKFEDISFSLRRGEVLGFAGLVGSGRSEIAETLFGMYRPTRGTVHIDGKRISPRTPIHAIRHGIGLVPEDRKRQGLVQTETCLHNTSLSILDRLSRLSWIRRREERAMVDDYFARLRVRTPSPDALVAGLSGGNQQKIVLARWLAAHSKVLILDEPTRGVDVGAKAEIHALISDLAATGTAILLISSELPELLGLADRLIVLREGRQAGELTRAEADQERVLRLMAGLGAAAPATSTPVHANAIP